MKICMYAEEAVLGGETGGLRRFIELAKGLIDAGHKLIFYTKDNSSDFEKSHLVCEHINITSITIKDKNRFLRKNSFDRVIVFDVRLNRTITLIGVRHIYLFLRQDLPMYRKIRLEDEGRSKLYKWCFLKMVCFFECFYFLNADKIVVQCQFDLDMLLQRHTIMGKLIRNKTVKQINNCNPSWVKHRLVGEETERIKKEFDIVFVGNFKNSRKGHYLLLRTIELLRKENIRVRVAVIGDGLQLDTCKKMCADNSDIYFMGRLNDPIPIIQKARMMIVPSYADSCPNTVMEALYNNVPVLGARSGGIPEILNEEEWIFDLSEKSLADAIKRTLEPGQLEKMRLAQSSRRKELCFDWRKVMARIVELC